MARPRLATSGDNELMRLTGYALFVLVSAIIYVVTVLIGRFRYAVWLITFKEIIMKLSAAKNLGLKI